MKLVFFEVEKRGFNEKQPLYDSAALGGENKENMFSGKQSALPGGVWGVPFI